jgi:hypothetical protein
MGRIRSAEIDPLVTDPEMLSLLQAAYFDLVETVILLEASSLKRPAKTTTFHFSRFS